MDSMDIKVKVHNEYGVFTLKELNRAYLECRSYIESHKGEIAELKNQISELESELAVKEDLLKIAMKFNRTPEENMRLADLFEDCEEEPLPFSCEEYAECLETKLEELRDRHQQDCITINQLHVTIDTLVDRYAKLREMRGL